MFHLYIIRIVGSSWNRDAEISIHLMHTVTVIHTITLMCAHNEQSLIGRLFIEYSRVIINVMTLHCVHLVLSINNINHYFVNILDI